MIDLKFITCVSVYLFLYSVCPGKDETYHVAADMFGHRKHVR